VPHTRIPDAVIAAMLGTGLVILRLQFLGKSARGLCAQAALTLSGYLRPRPDPTCERALRAIFAELDQELAAVLGDRASPRSLR
jgi:hypothetical protein